MKNRVLFYVVFVAIIIFLAGFLGCTKSTEPEEENGQEQVDSYYGVTSGGDELSFKIDTEKGEYSYTNESTGQTGSGTFTVSDDPNLEGVYITSDDHFIIEVPDELFITSLPLGRQSNLVFGVTSERNLSNETLTGDYAYLIYVEEGLEDAGGYRINSNGTFTYGICPHPDSITSPFDYFEGAGFGTWVVDPDDSSRIIATEDGVEYNGTIFPGKIMLFDNGIYEGFTLGLKYPGSPVSYSQIAGRYSFIDILLETGEYGVGYYDLPSSSAPVDYYGEYSGSTGSGEGTTSGNLERHPYVNNLFQVEDVTPEYSGDTYFILLPGDIMLHFCEDGETQELLSMGIAAKIN
jgi:hypothetical protein